MAEAEAARMDEFSARYSRPKLVGASLICAGFVVSGLWLEGVIGNPRRPPHHSSWPAIVMFGLSLIFFTIKIFDTKEKIRISPAGIKLYTHFDKTIPWADIDDVTTFHFKNQRYIILKLRNPEIFPKRFNLRLFSRLSKLLTRGDAEIALMMMNKSFDEAVSAMAKFRPPAQVQPQKALLSR
jgi:hypothetical protein